MTRLKLLIIFFAAYAYVAGVSASQAIYPLVTYKCNPEADIITLTNSLLKSDEGASCNYSDEEGSYPPGTWSRLTAKLNTHASSGLKKSPNPAH